MQITGRRGVTWRVPSITADGLKKFACVIVLLQTFGATVIEKGLINIDQYTKAGLSEALAEDSQLMIYAGLGSVLQLLGGLAVPFFAYLLVEGFYHTSSYKKYLSAIAFFAFLSEIPYDFAYSGKLIDWVQPECNGCFVHQPSYVIFYKNVPRKRRGSLPSRGIACCYMCSGMGNDFPFAIRALHGAVSSNFLFFPFQGSAPYRSWDYCQPVIYYWAYCILFYLAL